MGAPKRAMIPSQVNSFTVPRENSKWGTFLGNGVVKKERLVNNYRLYFSVFSIMESCRFQEGLLKSMPTI
jgi:hypothetical protein